jgi:hypothetical protein
VNSRDLGDLGQRDYPALLERFVGGELGEPESDHMNET